MTPFTCSYKLREEIITISGGGINKQQPKEISAENLNCNANIFAIGEPEILNQINIRLLCSKLVYFLVMKMYISSEKWD